MGYEREADVWCDFSETDVAFLRCWYGSRADMKVEEEQGRHERAMRG